MPFMWADSLLAAERAHSMQLLAWAAASVLLGTALVAMLRMRGQRTDLLDHFAVVTAVAGGAELAIAAWALRMLEMRDLASATRLDRMLWFRIGLEGGLILAGVALVWAAWRPVRRTGLIGGAIALVVQGAALALLDLLLTAQISR